MLLFLQFVLIVVAVAILVLLVAAQVCRVFIVAYACVFIALISFNGHINLITVHSEIARLSFINICTKKIYRTSIHFDFQILFPIFRRTNKCLFHVFVDVVEFCRNCTRTKLGWRADRNFIMNHVLTIQYYYHTINLRFRSDCAPSVLTKEKSGKNDFPIISFLFLALLQYI